MTNFEIFSKTIHDKLVSLTHRKLFQSAITDPTQCYLAAFPEGTDPLYITNTEHGYLASFSEINHYKRLPPAASYKACAIVAIKDVLEQVQQDIRFRANQLNKLSKELQ